MSCDNCGIDNSVQWRPIEGIIYCNPCGIYLKRNKCHRDYTKEYAKILIKMSKDKGYLKK